MHKAAQTAANYPWHYGTFNDASSARHTHYFPRPYDQPSISALHIGFIYAEHIAEYIIPKSPVR